MSCQRWCAIIVASFATGILTVAMPPIPTAEAQFFFRWREDRPRGAKPPKPAKPRAVKPRVKRPPLEDLPPIVHKEGETGPPPPDDRPYDDKLLRLAVILGAVHYLRELCGAAEGQLWRDKMDELVKHEGTTAVRRAKLVTSFNDGYRGYRRTYRTCTASASLATSLFVAEGARIAAALSELAAYGRRPTDETSADTGGAHNGGAPPKARTE